MVIRVFITTVSANATLKKHQQTIIDTLSAKNIPFEAVDISAPENDEQKQFMRAKAIAKGGQVMPPQIFDDDEYIGDYDAFYEATEDNNLDVFFKLASAVKSSEASVQLNSAQPEEPTSNQEPVESTTPNEETPGGTISNEETQESTIPDEEAGEDTTPVTDITPIENTDTVEEVKESASKEAVDEGDMIESSNTLEE